MKSIIETSSYILIMVLICYLGIEFTMMNKKVSRVNDLVQYASDYIEINGKTDIKGNGNKLIDQNIMQNINDSVEKEKVNFSCEYLTQTDQYDYYKMNTKYKLSVGILGINKECISSSIVRVQH